MATASLGGSDERIKKISLGRRLMARPELGAVAGAILVFIFFGIVGGGTGMFSALGVFTFLEVAAQLGIIAVGASLLMIGGEFDLSVGSMIGFAGVVLAVPATLWGWPLWLCILLAFAVAVAIGYVNGLIVTRTGLPSFIVTLAGLFILRGLTIGLTRLLTGRTQVSGLRPLVEEDWLAPLFAGRVLGGLFQWLADAGWILKRGDGLPQVQGLPMSIVWWLAISALATWVLLRTRVGNWIFASGGDANAARNVGVPVTRVKISLFITTAVCATIFACVQTLSVGSADVLRGELKEFEAIIASVIGGCLLTGGYGSAIGASFGALIFGTVQQGIFYTGVNTDWFKVFLGGMLLVAVLFNTYVRRKATEGR
ncbi:ABC transporter permease [Geminicoccaceae bacterium 1502E]|nr:ABC transporter permease [Geminicoccaceae bacterium 1502E]